MEESIKRERREYVKLKKSEAERKEQKTSKESGEVKRGELFWLWFWFWCSLPFSLFPPCSKVEVSLLKPSLLPPLLA